MIKERLRLFLIFVEEKSYNHFEANDDFADSSYDEYFDILKDLLFYLKGLNKNQS